MKRTDSQLIEAGERESVTRASVSRSRLALALAIAFVGCCVVLAFTVRAYSYRTPLEPTTIGPSSKVAGLVEAAQQEPEPPPQGFEAELVTIRPDGFEPREIKRPPGPFILFFENQSRLSEVAPQLSLLAGARLMAVRLPRGVLRWYRAVDLPPGEYVLTVPDHPKWECRLTITPS